MMNFDASHGVRAVPQAQKKPTIANPRPLSVRAGGTPEMSRWCNHRNSTPHHPKPPSALEGREKGTRGLAGNIAGGHWHPSRAPARAHPESGMVGRFVSGGFTTG